MLYPCHCQIPCSLPTVLSLDDLTAVLRLFLGISGVLDESISFTVIRMSGQREISEQRLWARCKHAARGTTPL